MLYFGGVNSDESHFNNSDVLGNDMDSSYVASQMPSQQGSNLDNIGLAVFKEDRLVGELTAIDTLCHLIVTNKLESCNISIPSPFSNISQLDLQLGYKDRTKSEVKLVNGTPYIKIKVGLNIRAESITAGSDYLNNENIKQIEEFTNSYLEAHISDYLYKTSKLFEADIASLGIHATSKFLTWNDWTSYNWLENYKNSFFDVEVDSSFRSSLLFQKT